MIKRLLYPMIVLLALLVFRSLFSGRPSLPTAETVATESPTVALPSPVADPTPPSGSERRVIALTAKQWTYEPFRLTVKQGEKLRVKIATADVPHSFMLPLTSGGEMAHITVEPGKPASTDFDVVHESGTYYFWCETPCGEGHSEMHGEFVVEACPTCV